MATRKEIDEYYQQHFGKAFPSTTLNKWVKKGILLATKLNNGRYDYDLNNFIQLVNNESYLRQMQAKKEKPNDYIGKIKGHLLITGIVPKEEYEQSYKGTLMYCDCLNCGKKNVQVRFTYLTDNGNYDQLTCGCGRKIRAFLASARKGITEDYLMQFDDFEKFLFVHKMLTHITDNYYGTHCDLIEYEQAIKYFYDNKIFNILYTKWLNTPRQSSTFYDMLKPSLDHIIPLSRGGTSQLSNLQVLTVFENFAKRDMTMEEWNNFKISTNTHSDYFIEEIVKAGDANEQSDDLSRLPA